MTGDYFLLEDIMTKIELLDLIQQDIEDIKSLVNYQKCSNIKTIMRNQARAIVLNLQDHLEEFIQQ